MKFLLTVIFCLLFLQGCASSKAYPGPPIPTKELALIYAPKATKFDEGEFFLLIEKVNHFEVGNPGKGWPSEIRVQPGKIVLGVRHREVSFLRTFAKTLAITAGGGIFGGSLASHFDSKSGLYEFTFDVQKGKVYQFSIGSESGSVVDMDLAITKLDDD